MTTKFQPVFELTRGKIVESTHFGAAAVVDSHGQLLASFGDPGLVTYLRSSAKPFQALPFIEREGHKKFNLTEKETAILCASHSGTEDHVNTVKAIQAKIGVSVDDLMCGFHAPMDEVSSDALKLNHEKPCAYHHNCSGKHTGMLAHAKLRDLPTADYVNTQHPIQKSILTAFSEMCNVDEDQVEIGIDGCSAPNFAIPLYNSALGYARLCDPYELAAERSAACNTITRAMMHFPNMVGGPNRFDTLLMQAGNNQIVSKGGAEGFQSVGIMPGALGKNSPGVGIAIKISDGDSEDRARSALALAILRGLGALNVDQLKAMSQFGPEIDLVNFRKIKVGVGRTPKSIKFE
jgi:L-asparaginase II